MKLLNETFQAVDPFFQTCTLVRYACIYFVSELNIVTVVHRSVLDNFHAAMKAVNDPAIDAVGGVNQLDQVSILSDPKQLASQFVARLCEVHTILMFFFPFKVRNFSHISCTSFLKCVSPAFQSKISYFRIGIETSGPGYASLFILSVLQF